MEPSRSLTRSTTTSSTRSFITALTRRGNDINDSPKGPLGLTTLYEPSGDQPVVADLIFVHGLNGGSQSTWSKGNMTTHFWPQEWLPKDLAFSDIRTHSFGYPSALSRESILNVHDFSRSLLAAVKDSPTMKGGEKVCIINLIESFRSNANRA